MPKLISETEVKLEWGDLESRVRRKRPKGAERRSSGVHLSGIISYVLETSGLVEKNETDEMGLAVAVGVAWEEFAVGLYPEMTWQPGEVHLDNVYGSPDGLTKGVDRNGVLADGESGIPIVLEEFKATWRSRVSKPPLANRRWMWQLSGYLEMMELRHARLHVLWINGNYKNYRPEYCTYLFEFEQPELDRFWNNVVLPNRDKAKREEHLSEHEFDVA